MIKLKKLNASFITINLMRKLIINKIDGDLMKKPSHVNIKIIDMRTLNDDKRNTPSEK